MKRKGAFGAVYKREGVDSDGQCGSDFTIEESTLRHAGSGKRTHF